MNYKHLLFGVLLLLVFGNVIPAQSLAPDKKPNVIFILGDDIGYDILTVNGGQSFNTPNLDSLARNGLNFTHCESTPLCNPSRQMLLTGRQNFRNYSNWGYLNDTAKTIGNLMRDAGYVTGFFGKLQLQLHSLANMNRWGWDKFTLFEVTDDSVKNSQRYKSPNLIDNKGRVADDIINGNYCDDILTTRIFNFIDNNKRKPFFIYYPMSIGHTPFGPTPDDPEYASWDPAKGKSDTSFYPSMVKYMDKKIGQIIAKLKQAGVSDNTIVFYAGDNGTPTPIYYESDNNFHQGQKGKPYEAGTHVPLIAYCPALITPGKNDDLIDFTDFFPTLGSLAKISSLKKYAPLDGVSFYNRLFGSTGDSVRTTIFSHYIPNPGLDDLNRWVRDKVYKLYDTTSPTYNGTFFNIKSDPEELAPIAGNLTPKQSRTKADFRKVLDTAGFWPKGPTLKNTTVSNVTNTSVKITGTVAATGASALIERGTTYINNDIPYYRCDHQADALATLGTFSQTRTGLDPQTQYLCAAYAMNANASNSTGYALDTFFTLSNPVLKQPTSLQVTDVSCGVNVKWNNAGFPKGGATVGGYVLIYSTNQIVLNTNADGNAPSALVTDSKSRMVIIKSVLPVSPATSANITTLSKDSLYYFSLVPYTTSGIVNQTYNYLTNGALTVTKKPSKNGCTSAMLATTITRNINPSSGVIPNPSRTDFTLQIDKALIGKQVLIVVTDAVGRAVYRFQNKGVSNIRFGSGWKAGVYFVQLSSGDSFYVYRVVKE